MPPFVLVQPVHHATICLTSATSCFYFPSVSFFLVLAASALDACARAGKWREAAGLLQSMEGPCMRLPRPSRSRPASSRPLAACFLFFFVPLGVLSRLRCCGACALSLVPAAAPAHSLRPCRPSPASPFLLHSYPPSPPLPSPRHGRAAQLALPEQRGGGVWCGPALDPSPAPRRDHGEGLRRDARPVRRNNTNASK